MVTTTAMIARRNDMSIQAIPKFLFGLKNIRVLMEDGTSCIMHKVLRDSLEETRKFVSTPLLVYIVRGRQVVHDHLGEEYRVAENHMVFLPKEVYFVSDFVASNGVFEAYLFFIDDKIIERFLKLWRTPDIGPARQVPKEMSGHHVIRAGDQLRNCIASLMPVYSAGGASSALLELKLHELLHLIAAQEQSLDFIDALQKRSRQQGRRPIIEFMEEYSVYNLKLEDYAALTGRSLSTFMRDFKKAYNMTPNQWVIDRKVEIAHRMLMERNVSVMEAAMEAGYANTSHFIKAYKRRFGLTPKKAKDIGDAITLS